MDPRPEARALLLLGEAARALLRNKARSALTVFSLALVFSIGVGIFFGFYPARMDPIAALRRD